MCKFGPGSGRVDKPVVQIATLGIIRSHFTPSTVLVPIDLEPRNVN